MKELLKALGKKAPSRCLLIGGIALAEYGSPRSTFDIDLAISETDVPLFDRFLPFLSYRKIAETNCAARFRHTQPLPDLDVIYLSPTLFDTLWGRSFVGQTGLQVIAASDWELVRYESCAGKPSSLASESPIAMDKWLARSLKEMRETFDPVSYVIYREDCPLPTVRPPESR